MKRLDSLFKLLQEPYELTVQRSAIVIIKALHTHGTKNASQFEGPTRDVIDAKIKSSFPGCAKGHTAFQQMQLSDTMFEEVGSLLNLFLSNRDMNDRGLIIDGCSVQIKCLEGGTKRRIPFRKASIDWNLNGMMARYEDDSTINWPFFAVQKVEWRRKNKDLWMRHRGWEGRKATNVVVRFPDGSLDETLKSNIEQRIRDVMFSAESDSGFGSDRNVPNSEDSDIVEIQHVKTMRGKSSIPRERCDRDDGDPQGEGENDGNDSVHGTEVVEHGNSGEDSDTTQDPEEMVPVVTTDPMNVKESVVAEGDNQIEEECAIIDWAETIAGVPFTINGNASSKRFLTTNGNGVNNTRNGQSCVNAIEIADAIVNASGESSCSAPSYDSEHEGLPNDRETRGKASERRERKNRVQFAANAEEIEVIVISDDENSESVDCVSVGNSEKEKGIKEENIIENVETGKNIAVQQSQMHAESRKRISNFRNQNKLGKRTRTRKQGTMRKVHSSGNDMNDETFPGNVSDDDPVGYNERSDESSEYQDLSDDDYVPGSLEDLADDEIESSNQDVVRTRRLAKEQVMARVDNDENQGTCTNGRTNLEQRGLDSNEENIENGITETEVEVVSDGGEADASDHNIIGNDLESNIIEDYEEFETCPGEVDLVDCRTPKHGLGNSERGISAGTDTVDDVEARESDVRDMNEIIEEIQGEDSQGNIGESDRFLEGTADEPFTEENIKDTGEVAEDKNRNDGPDQGDKELDKSESGTANMIDYGEMTSQFGSLVENLNEVSKTVRMTSLEKTTT